jgi:hypothetical protein
MIALLMMLLGAPSAAPSAPRFACDADTDVLSWELQGATVRAGDAGLELSDSPIANPARPLAPRGAAPPVTFGFGESDLVIRGTLLQGCAAQRCHSLGRLPVVVWAGIADEDTALLAAGGPQPGLYRAALADLLHPHLIAAGEVLALCPGEDGAWALLQQNAEARLVMASARTPAVTRLGFTDAVVAAARGFAQPIAALEVALSAVMLRDASARRALGDLLLADSRPEARSLAARALADDPSAWAAAQLYALAHDSVESVRAAALEAVVAALPQVSPRAGSARLALFIDDPSQDVAWSARDALLGRSVELALGGASSAYKLDALSILARRRERDGPAAVREALHALSRDNDPSVRAAADSMQSRDDP